MPIRPARQPLAAVAADWLAVGLFDGATDAPPALRGTAAAGLFARGLAGGDLPTKLGDTLPLLGVAGLEAGAVLAVGLGPRDAFDAGAAFAAGVAAAKKLAGRPRGTVAVALPEGVESPAVASALVEGLVVGQCGPDLRKAEPARHPFRELVIVAAPDAPPDAAALERAVRRGAVVGEAVNLARTLANTPPAEKAPTLLAARARAVAEAAGLVVAVRDADWLRAERFGGILGVAAGSDEPPALVTLEHRRGGGPPLALVGKGVTFDSGGLSLKPSASMEDMKADMTGAAVVLAAMQAVARLDLPVDVVAHFALVENMTGGRAMKLGDVLTHRDGTTVEVMNTDAEGRLVLADCLAYAVEGGPAQVLDLATLTGACLVALGIRVAGLFSNDDALAAEVQAAGRLVGERTWRLPLDDDYRDALKSPVADLKNVGGKWGGAITAAKFLQHFVGATPWAHLDIAGPSWSDADTATRDVGGTGCFVRALVALIEARATRMSA